jgi:hypothetical protein
VQPPAAAALVALPCPVCHQLHREQAVTGRIFQALLTQTDTIVALIYKMQKGRIIFYNSHCHEWRISNPPQTLCRFMEVFNL